MICSGKANIFNASETLENKNFKNKSWASKIFADGPISGLTRTSSRLTHKNCFSPSTSFSRPKFRVKQLHQTFHPAIFISDQYKRRGKAAEVISSTKDFLSASLQQFESFQPNSRKMRVTIAIFAFLIVGSNAGLLGGILNPVNNLLDASNAVSTATGLLNSLQSQINNVAATAVSTITGELKKVTDAVQNLENGALSIANGLVNQGVDEAAGLVSELTDVVAQVLGLVEGLVGGLLGSLLGSVPNPSDLVSQINGVINNLESQINGLVQPLIDALNKNVASGVVKLQCLVNEVPEIKGNISAVVGEVEKALDDETSVVIQQVAGLVANITAKLTGLTNGVQACGVDVNCQVQLVTLRLRNFCC